MNFQKWELFSGSPRVDATPDEAIFKLPCDKYWISMESIHKIHENKTNDRNYQPSQLSTLQLKTIFPSWWQAQHQCFFVNFQNNFLYLPNSISFPFFPSLVLSFFSFLPSFISLFPFPSLPFRFSFLFPFFLPRNFEHFSCLPSSTATTLLRF